MAKMKSGFVAAAFILFVIGYTGSAEDDCAGLPKTDCAGLPETWMIYAMLEAWPRPILNW